MKTSPWLVGSILFLIAAIVQIYATIRYYGRLPEDYIGIVLYVVNTILFAILSFGFFLQWKKNN
jgi:hypothetical protein